MLPLHHKPVKHARLESNQRPLPSQSSALPLSYDERVKEPPAGVEPAPRPYKGRVLAVDTTEARDHAWRWSESNRHPPRCKRGARPVELHPRKTKCGRVESNHQSQGRQGYSLLSSPVLSVRRRCSLNIQGRPTGFEPALRGSRPRVLAVTPQPPRTGTTEFEPAASRLTSECSAC